MSGPPSELAARLAPWNLSEIVKPLPGGATQNVVLARRGTALYVAKSTKWSPPALRWVAQLQALALRVGLSLPAYIAAAPGLYAPGGFTLEPFVPGDMGKTKDLPALAPALRRLHAQTREWPARPGQNTSNAPERWRHLTHTRCKAWPQSAIHGDVGPRNVIRAPNGCLVLIDWDEARCGPSALDFSWQKYSNSTARNRLHAVEEIAQTWAIEPRHARALARRYLLTHPAARRIRPSNTRIASAVRS